MNKNYCEHCHDGNGGCVFPYMGLAPHIHHTGFSDTEILSKSEYPENFSETEDGMGMYTHCLVCGADGNPVEENNVSITNEQIKKIALENGFKLKDQPNGELDLNPYVYDFARALLQSYAVSEHDQVWRERLSAVIGHVQSNADYDRPDDEHSYWGGYNKAMKEVDEILRNNKKGEANGSE